MKLQDRLQNLYGFDATGATIFQAVEALNAIEEILTEAVNAEAEACAHIADKEARVYRRAASTLERMGTVAAERIGSAIRARRRKRE